VKLVICSYSYFIFITTTGKTKKKEKLHECNQKIQEILEKNQKLIKEVQCLEKRNQQLQTELIPQKDFVNYVQRKMETLMSQSAHFGDPIFERLVQAKEKCNQVMEMLMQEMAFSKDKIGKLQAE
jgi:hypothetical protein